MHAALALVPGGGAELRVLEDDGTPARPVGTTIEQAGQSTDHVADLERSASPRWILADVAAGYPPLLRAGVRLARCHDLAATEALLLAAEGDAAGAAAITAARAGAATAAADPAPQPSLFEAGPPTAPPPDAAALASAYAEQLVRIERIRAAPARLRAAGGRRVGVLPRRGRDERDRRPLGRRDARPVARRAARAAPHLALGAPGRAAGAGRTGCGRAGRPAGQPRLPG